MKYTRDLISEFNTEAKKRGISVDQLPSGEQHIYRQKMEGLLDQDLSIQTKVYFDQMEQRGFTKENQEKHAQEQSPIESIIDNAFNNLAILENMLGGGKK